MAARIAVIQTDPAFGEVARNLEDALALAAGVRAELVVLPELFATGYQFTSKAEARALAEPAPGGPTVAALEALARASGATVVAGLAEAAEGEVFNAAAIVYPSGFLTTYRKIHLFGEENDWFAPGRALPPVIRTPQGLRVGIMICFDWYFPEVARHLALGGADVIAHPANLVLPHCPDAMPVRCLENRVFAATADRVGVEARGGRRPLRYIGRSQVVSPLGERVAALGGEAPGIAIAEVDPGLARTKAVTPRDDLFRARRADLFGDGAATRPAREGGYAALLHTAPGASPHVDLFFESGGRLIAFRAAALDPLPAEVERAFDHRKAYLEREGDLGGARGVVRRVDAGRALVLEERRDVLRVEVRGAVLAGEFVFREVGDERWRVERERRHGAS
jgi:predicted amidohydrolase